MEKLKKLISILLSCVIMLTAAGCQSKNKGKTTITPDVSISSDASIIMDGKIIEADVPSILNEFKVQINALALKYLDAEDLDKVQIESICLEKNGESSSLLLNIKVEKVKDLAKLKLFLDKVNKIVPIKGFKVDSSLVSEIEKDFDNIENLTITNDSIGIPSLNLENFKNIKYLTLNRVQVNNMPATVTSIEFVGCKDPKTNVVDKSYDAIYNLRQLSGLNHIQYLGFTNIDVNYISLPITNTISLNFTDCTGLTNIYFSNSDNVEIINTNSDGVNYNDITILGKINENLVISAPYHNVNVGQVNGNPNVSYFINNPEFVVTQGDVEIQTTSTLTLKQ